MYGILCTLSPKRMAQLETEPDLVEEIIEAIGEDGIPGGLELQKTWHALDILVCGGDDGKPLSSALIGRGGQALGPSLSFAPAQVLSVETVVSITRTTLDELQATLNEMSGIIDACARWEHSRALDRRIARFMAKRIDPK